MSESSSASGSSVAASSLVEGQPGHGLSSELAKLSLPVALRDEYRKLAWANSICFLFLVIGLIGIKARPIVVKPITPPVEAVPVIFVPPQEQPKQEPEQTQPDEARPTEEVVTPQVVTVAAPDAAKVAFAVPVKGPVAVAESVRLATPPPPAAAPKPPQPKAFDPSEEKGTFPWPRSRDYPREALNQRVQGTVVLYIVVDPSGVPTTVDIKESSGHFVLDQFAVQWVKNKWRWLPGDTRLRLLPWEFKLQ